MRSPSARKAVPFHRQGWQHCALPSPREASSRTLTWHPTASAIPVVVAAGLGRRYVVHRCPRPALGCRGLGHTRTVGKCGIHSGSVGHENGVIQRLCRQVLCSNLANDLTCVQELRLDDNALSYAEECTLALAMLTNSTLRILDLSVAPRQVQLQPTLHDRESRV